MTSCECRPPWRCVKSVCKQTDMTNTFAWCCCDVILLKVSYLVHQSCFYCTWVALNLLTVLMNYVLLFGVLFSTRLILFELDTKASFFKLTVLSNLKQKSHNKTSLFGMRLFYFIQSTHSQQNYIFMNDLTFIFIFILII